LDYLFSIILQGTTEEMSSFSVKYAKAVVSAFSEALHAELMPECFIPHFNPANSSIAKRPLVRNADEPTLVRTQKFCFIIITVTPYEEEVGNFFELEFFLETTDKTMFQISGEVYDTQGRQRNFEAEYRLAGIQDGILFFQISSYFGSNDVFAFDMELSLLDDLELSDMNLIRRKQSSVCCKSTNKFR